MSDTSTSPLSETVALEEKVFKGFPWPLALVLYSLSWGWSLLRPNTLFWDDWVYIFKQPKSNLNQIFVETGLPPWRALLDQEMIAIGNWTIPWFTFAMYFAAGAFLWEILKKTHLLTPSQIKFVGSWVNLQNYGTTELSNLLLLSDQESTAITGKGTCNDLRDGTQFVLKSDKNFFSALTSRDLGLYFEVSPCSDILTTNP